MFRLKIFLDTADLNRMEWAFQRGLAQGFTTNPSLMRKAGVSSYEEFAQEALRRFPGVPISFEVFADELPEMERQARRIAPWGENVYVKIPVTNTRGESTMPVVAGLTAAGIKVNVTAVLTLEQVQAAAGCLAPGAPAIVSVFAGRIADTGHDPVPLMREARGLLQDCPHVELLWASTRETLNIYQAEETGCHVITVPPEILARLELAGRDLKDYSLDTVRTFYADAQAAGYSLGAD